MAQRQLIVKIIGDSKSLERAFSRAGRSGSTFGRDIKRAGIGVAALAGTFTVAGVKAAKFGADFQDTMQQIVGLSGVAQKQVDGFSDAILKLAPTVGRGPQELAKALYFITSSGIAASDAMNVLTVSAKASVAGLGETATVADAVTSAINAYGAANLGAQQATDVLVATVREGKGEASAFAGVIGNVASLASQLSISFNDVGAALAAETRLGIDAETASVQLQQVFSNLVKVAPAAEKAFKSVGLSSAGLRDELGKKGLLATLQTIKTAFAGNLPALAKAFPNIRALRGVLALVGNQAGETAKIFDRMKDSTGSLKTAFDAVSKDTAQQFRKMRAAVEVLGIRVGAALAPLAGVVANAVGGAADAVSNFVTILSEARGFHAKLNVVWEGAKTAADKASSLLREAFDKINWAQVWQGVKGIAEGLGQRVANIDWSAVGHLAGRGLNVALREIADAVRSVNWNEVGQQLIHGIGQAFQALATFIKGVNWKAVFTQMGRVIGDVLRGLGSLLLGIGEALGKAIVGGIGQGLANAGAAIAKQAIRLVLTIIEPFTHLPGWLGGGPFQDMKDGLNSTLAQMAVDGKKGGQNIGAAVAAGIAAGVGPASKPDRHPKTTAAVKKAAAAAVPKAATVATTAAAAAVVAAATARKGITPAQRNTFFDNDITRLLDRSQDGGLKAQLRKLQAIAGLLVKRIAVTKDITRKLHLEDELIGVIRQEKEIRSQIVQAREDQAAKRIADRTAKQFQQLGLTGTGDERTPGVPNLKKRLAGLTKSITGTSLDTPKLKSQLARFRKVLSEGLVPKDVRGKIKEMLDGIADELKNHTGPLTKTTALSVDNILKGVTVGGAAEKLLKARLSHFNSGGVALAGSGAGSSMSVNVSSPPVYIDGRLVSKSVGKHQARARKRNAAQRNGPNAGVVID